MSNGQSGAARRRTLLLGLVAAAAARPAVAWSAATRSPPAVVWLIRHAEKPDEAGNPNLSLKGIQRAAAIAQAFPARFKPITALFASQPVGASYRPFETVLPLYNALAGAPPSFSAAVPDGEYQTLATHILGDAGLAGNNVFICWHHGKLPDLARALAAGRTVVDGAGNARGADGRAYRIPARWDGVANGGGHGRKRAREAESDSDVFDRVWQLSFVADGSVAFVDLPQKLLPGDSSDTRGPAT